MITEKEILEKYPKIFAYKDKSMTETCMCWGLEVPDNWLPIIDQLCDAMQSCGYSQYSEELGQIEFPQVVAEQVKTKFNQLRFYYRLEYGQDVPDEIYHQHRAYIDGMIAMAENMIYKLKEE